jgi:small subunit ribosomal protein S13
MERGFKRERRERGKRKGKKKEQRGVRGKEKEQGGVKKGGRYGRCGKGREGSVGLRRGRQGVYGCGKKLGKELCRGYGRSERVRVGECKAEYLRRREKELRKKYMRGSERKRKERRRSKEAGRRRTVREQKKRIGLPVRGQRTGTNGKTARRLNSRRP